MTTAIDAHLCNVRLPAPLSASHAHCRDVARRAGNFYYAMRLVPEPKRSAMYALYAWMREVDDVADGLGTPDEKIPLLERFWADTLEALENPDFYGPARSLWPAFRDAARRHELSPATLREHVTGQMLDQQKTRYATLDELYDYCRRVASTVGLLCVQIWGAEGDPAVRQLTEWRGIALQLTNVVRDVVEDARLGRVYLPEEVARRAVTPDMIDRSCRGGGCDGEVVIGAVAALSREALKFYARSAPLDGYVHPDGRSSLRAMTRIYRELLLVIDRDPTVVLAGRVSLPAWRKAWIALSAVAV